MKRCDRCKRTKPIEDFNWRNRAKGKRHGTCRDCKKVVQRAYYVAHHGSYLATIAQSKRIRNRNLRIKLWRYLEEHACVDCGESDPRCLQFDHVRGEKEDPVSILVSNGVSWARIEAEIAKCEVRCANCHCKVTAERAGWYAYIEEAHVSEAHVGRA